MSQDDSNKITHAAHHLHTGSWRFDLPGPLVASLLNRKHPAKEFDIFTMNLDSDPDWRVTADSITYGDRVIWRTGAIAVAHQVILRTMESDLQQHDRTLFIMWWRHRQRLIQDGYSENSQDGFGHVFRYGSWICGGYPEYEAYLHHRKFVENIDRPYPMSVAEAKDMVLSSEKLASLPSLGFHEGFGNLVLQTKSLSIFYNSDDDLLSLEWNGQHVYSYCVTDRAIKAAEVYSNAKRTIWD